MSYNWDRAPTPWERYRKGLITSAILAALAGVLVWPVL